MSEERRVRAIAVDSGREFVFALHNLVVRYRHQTVGLHAGSNRCPAGFYSSGS
ncbi:hypothetical protein D3C80_1197410 [compost metagenome]